MIYDFLRRRHARLQQALSIAYTTLPWDTAKIDRLADRLVATERRLVTFQSIHAHGTGWPGFVSLGSSPASPGTGSAVEATP